MNLSLRGEKFQFIYGHTIEEVLDQENDDLQSAQEKKKKKIIRDVLLKANEERLRYKNKNNMNLVEITVQKNPHAMVLHTMLALIAAIVIGVLMKVFVPSGVNEALNNTIFTSISTMFLNALKMIVGPVVFFLHSMLHFPIWRSERSRTYWWKNHGLLPAYHGSGNSYGNRCV